MSEKVKNRLDKINKWLTILCAVTFIAAACRITHCYITEYNDNSINDYSVVKVETPKNNNESKNIE